MSSDAPEAPTTTELSPRVVLARRVEFLMIFLGGVFIIFGWGIGHQEWARALGWLLAGIGFAIEMVYGRMYREARAGKQSSRSKAQSQEAQSQKAQSKVESTTEPTSESGSRLSDESAP